jgi:hypothetical protein
MGIVEVANVIEDERVPAKCLGKGRAPGAREVGYMALVILLRNPYAIAMPHDMPQKLGAAARSLGLGNPSS